MGQAFAGEPQHVEGDEGDRRPAPAPLDGSGVFSVQGQKICQATTNSSGVASCTSSGIAITFGSGSYTASFGGDADYLSSSGTAKL